MLQLHSQRKIKFFTVETATEWQLFACVVEMQGEQVIFASEPRLVKTQLKKVPALKGKVLALALPEAPRDVITPDLYLSPLSAEFEYRNAHHLVWYSAQPPTVSK